MSEGEVVEQLVQFTNLLLVATGVFFTILSVYVVVLNYALQNETWLTKAMLFFFVSLAFGMLAMIMVGARNQHLGLTARLAELEAEGGLTAAGRAALGNAQAPTAAIGPLSIDEIVVSLVWVSFVVVYAILFYLTFIYRWRPDGPFRH